MSVNMVKQSGYSGTAGEQQITLSNSVSASTPRSGQKQDKPGGAEMEAPKALRPRRRRRQGGWEWGGGVPLPIQLRDLGERSKRPAESGAEHPPKTILVHLKHHNLLLVALLEVS